MENYSQKNEIKLKFKIADRDIELTGTKQDVLDTVRELEKMYGGTVNLSANVAIGQPSKERRRTKTAKEHQFEIPSVDQLVAYLLTKDKYAYDIFEIEDVFLKQRISARDNQTIYRKLSAALEKARHRIEMMKQGKYEQQLTSSKNLKKYVFKSIVQTLTQTYNGKTSPTS